MPDEKENIELEETNEETNSINESVDEDDILFRLEKIDILLDKIDMQLENVEKEDLELEENQKKLQERKELLEERKALNAQLKLAKKGNKENSTIWDKLNIFYIVYGFIALLMVVYPIGPRISTFYLDFALNIAKKLIAGLELSSGSLQVIFAIIYSLYYIIFVLIDLIIYHFIKKNKVNFWTMIINISLHLIASIISLAILLPTMLS